MAVYDDQRNRGGTRSTPDERDFDPRSIMSEDEEREAERRAFDEHAAGMAEAENQRSSSAERIMKAEQAAVKGGNILNKSAAGLGARLAGKDPKDAPEPEDFDDLYNKEKRAEGGYYQEESGSNTKPKGFFANIRRKTTKANLIFGALFTLVGVIIGVLQTVIQPFQIPTIAQFLEDTKYAAFNNAGDRAFEHAFTSYIAAILMPGMRANGCPSTKVARTCTGDLNGDGPIRLLYRKLAGIDGKNTSIEYKMAQRGVEIQFNARTGQYYMRSPSMGNGGSTDLADADCDDRRCANISRLLSDRGISNMFEMRELSRAEVKAEIKRILEDESDYRGLLYRMRVGNFLKKYGMTRCLVACKFKEKLYGTRTELNKSGLALINARLFETRASLLGLYLNCMMSPCDDVLSSPGVEADESTMGEASTELHRSQRAVLATLQARFGEQKLNDMVARINDLNRDGLSLHLTKLAVERIGGALPGDRELTPEAVTRIVGGPIAAALVAVRIIVLVSQATQLKDIHYLALTSLAVSTASLMTTTAHETKAGQMDARILGSITNVYRHGAFNTGPGMDDSPVWEETVASVQNRPAMAFMRTFLPQKAYAAAANGASLTYMCSDGRSIYSHQGEPGNLRNKACPELRAGLDGNAAVEAGEFIRNTPGLNLIAYAGDIFLTILDYLTEVFLDFIISLIPAVGELLARINEFILPIMTAFFFDILRDPLGEEPSGARMTELAVLGFEQGGADSAHRLWGGQILSPGQQAAIMREETQKMQDKFAAMPLKDRLFSPETPYSLTGQVALTAPTDLPGAAREAFAGLLGNPAGKLFGSFASIFTANRAVAQDITYRPSMFDVVQHGYPVDHPIWSTDFQQYWDDNCADPEQKQNVAYNTDRNDIDDPELQPFGFVKDELTNQPVNPVANPCFLLYTLSRFDEPPKGAGGGRSGPITRNGIQLLLNGQPWKFAGVNADTWFGCWPNDIPDDATLDRYFSELNPNSLTRIWPYGHMADVEIMDRIVAKAHQYNQYLMVTLFDGNEGQCGTQPIGNTQANFASIQPFIQRYAKGAHPHADAIGFWEMSNESCNGGWFNELAPLIKQADPGTLISTGSHAAWCYSGTGEYTEAHRSEAIDLISMHEYDAATGVSHWGGPAAEAARTLNKPWFSGEDGFCCGGGDEGQAGNAEKVKVEWQAYIDEPESAGMLYWDFKITHPASATMTFGSPMWQAASEFRHQYNGGAAAAP